MYGGTDVEESVSGQNTRGDSQLRRVVRINCRKNSFSPSFTKKIIPQRHRRDIEIEYR